MRKSNTIFTVLTDSMIHCIVPGHTDYRPKPDIIIIIIMLPMYNYNINIMANLFAFNEPPPTGMINTRLHDEVTILQIVSACIIVGVKISPALSN